MSSLVVRNHTFAWGSQTYVMGILNVTPDSFSGDGLVGLDTLRYSTGGEAVGLDTLRYSTGGEAVGLDTLRYSTGGEAVGLDTLRYSTGGEAVGLDTLRYSTGGEAVGLDTLRYSTGEDEWVRAAVAQGRRFVAEGAHMLDVGGESTRPGSQPVDADEELRRVLPVIEGLVAAVDVPVSIDTSKAAVAEAALAAGASIVNDVWGLRLDPLIADVAARAGAPVILMHNRSQREHVSIDPALGGRYVGTNYDDLLGDIAAELQVSIDLARRAGIPDSHIILDPGLGFGKTVAQNLALLDRLGELRGLGYPLLAGPSRKSFIGYTLDLPPDQRVEGTAAAVAIAIARGADIVRVHDVQAMARVARMADAIVRRET